MKLFRTFKFTSQTEQTDCGPACLKMMCDNYHKDVSLRFIKESMPLSRIGVTMRDMVAAARSLGFECAAISCDTEKLKKLKCPVILYWKTRHYVICYRADSKTSGEVEYYIADPACGKYVVSEAELIDLWCSEHNIGYGIFLSPGSDFNKSRNAADLKGTNIIKELIDKYHKYFKFIALSIVLMAVAIGCTWAIPLLYERIINNAVIEGDINLVWQLFLIQLSFFIGYLLSDGISSILISKVNFKISLEYLSGLLRKIIGLPLKYFDTRLNTEFLQRMDDYYKLQDFLTGQAIATFFAVLNLIVFSCMLAWYTVSGLIIFIIFSALSAFLTMYYLPKYKFINYSLFTARAKNRNIMYEIVNGMPDIKSNNAEEKHIDQWSENQHKINELSIKNLLIDQKQSVLNSSINRLRDILVISLCAFLVIREDLSIGALMSVSYILGQLTVPISQIQSIPKLLQDAGIVVDRLSEIQLRKTEREHQTGQSQTSVETINFNNVSFKYEGSFCPYIFEGLSLKFEKGKTTAIVGNSGSGKTTLVKLLLGFYMPQKGTVTVGSIPMSDIDLALWRKNCGTVLQDGKIFSMSVAENIALGDKVIDNKRLIECAKMACIHDHIDKMPSKYNTLIGGAVS